MATLRHCSFLISSFYKKSAFEKYPALSCLLIPCRCCIEIQLKDSSAMITAAVFGEKAEKLFSVTAT